ncbi:MAG TPA: hypothetical protein VLA68_01705 [Nitrososphaera sp.]|nr:hypothetical protein [Nitrososphaera sp.]
MTQHGDYDSQQLKWFCSYWMSQAEWLEVHDYAPAHQKDESDEDEEQD